MFAFATLPQKTWSQTPFCDYLCKKQDSLPIREKTLYIIWHTTEGPWPGCRNWLMRGPWGHFVTTKTGFTERIVEDERFVEHAGHSMYNGDTAISRFSVSIEFVQYQGDTITQAQYDSGMVLTKYLQMKYCIPDSCVLIHPAVACFYPGDFKSKKRVRGRTIIETYTTYARGRKQDAYEFANTASRALLGVGPGPRYDLDVVMGRMVPDAAQERLLYGKNFSIAELIMLREMIEYRENPIAVSTLSVRKYEICNTVLWENEIIFQKPKKAFSIDTYFKREDEIGITGKAFLKFLSE